MTLTMTRPAATNLRRSARKHSAARRLACTELRLATREPIVLTFVLAFPIVTMLIIGNSFGTTPKPEFADVDPSQWYVASYFTVVIGSIGLIMVPVHLAAYRERGVLRRFAAAGFPRRSFAVAVLVVGTVAMLLGTTALLLVAWPVFGVPAPGNLWRVVVATLLGTVAFVALGVTLGTVLPSARAAQAVGLLLFFPSFLLGAGGPPPAVLGDTMSDIADLLPLTWATKAIRDPWLGIGTGTPQLIAVAVLTVLASGFALRRAAL